MLTDKEMLEYELLNQLNDVKKPKGAVTLSLLLKDKGLVVSSATVGRMLSGFDYQGLTARYGYQGRVLTDDGEKWLSGLKSRRRLEEVSFRLYSSIDAESKENLINVLIARRGIERESARLAALNATPENIENLSRVYNLQAKGALEGLTSADKDVIFHQLIAKASKNKVLAAAYDFIWQNGRFSPVMEYIRSSVGGVISLEHKKILNALIIRNPDEAEKSMVEHIDSLISDVNEYWLTAQGKRS